MEQYLALPKKTKWKFKNVDNSAALGKPNSRQLFKKESTHSLENAGVLTILLTVAIF